LVPIQSLQRGALGPTIRACNVCAPEVPAPLHCGRIGMVFSGLVRSISSNGSVANGPVRNTSSNGSVASETEVGEWYYIVTDVSGFTSRKTPTCKRSEKTTHFFDEGEVVKVVQRTERGQDGARYLMLDEGKGWAFDRQPGIINRERLRELETEHGDWVYQIVKQEGIPIFCRPKFLKRHNNAATDSITYGELVDVDRRVRCGSIQFLHIMHRRAWMLNNIETQDHTIFGPIPLHPDGRIMVANYGITVLENDPSMKRVSITRPPTAGKDDSQKSFAIQRKHAW